MSYLGLPRLIFSGRFHADPPTVNNDPTHYDVDRFRPQFQKRQTTKALNGWWNPRGTGSWRVGDCLVTTGVLDGSSRSAPAEDTIIGGRLSDVDDRVSAKLVDLDPDQQVVSEIWGLRLQLRHTDGREAFRGDFTSAPFADLWARFPLGRPDSFFGAMYQSALAPVHWSDDDGSAILQQLRAHSGGRLSIKFNVDGYNDDFNSPTFGSGRIVGSIGPAYPGEPSHFVASRRLSPTGGLSPLNSAPCVVDENAKTLVLDLGNSLPTTAPGGDVQDLGPLTVSLLPTDGPPVALGTIAPATGDLYAKTAGIVTVSLDESQVIASRDQPLGLVDSTGAVVLAENADGTYLRCDAFVFRLAPIPPDNIATATIYATRFGRPVSGIQVTVALHGEQAGIGKRGLLPASRMGTPADALTFPPTVTTDQDGTARLVITASSPGNPRGAIDGQVFLVDYLWMTPSAAVGDQISVLVWDDYTVPEQPTWVEHVQPVLQQYANLYPVMRDVVDLTDYHSVTRARSILKRTLALPLDDPNHMPVTRDLSPGKRAMILRWLGMPNLPVLDIADLAGLRRALQLAIALEHATIPPYLSALFSIEHGSNAEAAEILRSVVVQEMLHMALACNILNALGGRPVIGRPGFVPLYPGKLPAGVRPDVTVRLRRYSLDQVRDVFMAIEQPAQTFALPGADELGPAIVDSRSVTVDLDGNLASDTAGLVAALEHELIRVEHAPLTIGWLYSVIGRGIIALEDSGIGLFTGDPDRQLRPTDWPDSPGRLYRVTDRATALLAIHEISRQGEGTTLADPTDDRHELAHYFRFQELVVGRQMVRNDAGEWAFDGPRVPFDPGGILPTVDDPDTDALDQGSPVRVASASFDVLYARLLGALHEVVNGSPSKLADTVGLMFAVEVSGRELARMPTAPGSGLTAGASFRSS